ncbi:HAD-IB family phosphatase [Candidatus Lokiarchaeum ossiferum]|uniref:HAD-IB family phosphatase n=1 Tax=Candidatus Lokiarchaeum ossiferum TaxID=2951803 RepID=UPI00352C59E7
MSDYIILCDFDGTISLQDTCVPILEQFADGDWELYDDLLSKGLIDLHECMRKQFGMIRADIPTILRTLGSVPIRSGFTEFVSFSLSEGIEFVIVSAGLDFIIKSVLLENNLDLPVVSAKVVDERFNLEFPALHYPDSIDFKADQVKFYQTQKKKVVFIGDGNSDLQGASQADIVFAVKSSFLNSHFENSFSNFLELIECLKKRIISPF